jgi:hypothetical protein
MFFRITCFSSFCTFQFSVTDVANDKDCINLVFLPNRFVDRVLFG